MLFIQSFHFFTQRDAVYIPINSSDRQSIQAIALTNIGTFGMERQARPNIPRHLHTGIDITPPNDNYKSVEHIFPMATGVVISKRTDGAYAQLIIEHDINGRLVWTVYEHITDIKVDLFGPVTSDRPIARFFLAPELDKIGWQFNHFHFEILKKRPLEIKPDTATPERRFNAYTLSCVNDFLLHEHYYDPLVFLKQATTK